MMNNTKNYTTRLRLSRQVDFSEDFRKRFMTREYGNYQKYEEGRNTVEHITEKGENDMGFDKLYKNDSEATKRQLSVEGETAREVEEEQIRNILENQSYADQTIKDRLNAMNFINDYPEEQLNKEQELKMVKGMEQQDIQFNGRMSPIAKEELYRNYLKGMTIKDLSLKYGCLPQRVKAIIFQRHMYWHEVYPKLGETHLRLAMERELLYA